MLGGPEVHVPLPRCLHRIFRIITISVSSMSPGPATAAATYTASAAGRARETNSISVVYGRLTSELTGLSVQKLRRPKHHPCDLADWHRCEARMIILYLYSALNSSSLHWMRPVSVGNFEALPCSSILRWNQKPSASSRGFACVIGTESQWQISSWPETGRVFGIVAGCN